MIVRNLAALALLTLIACAPHAAETASTATAGPSATAVSTPAVPAKEALAKTASLAEFPTEAGAQAHCSSDLVVWLNTRSGVYHEKGTRFYANTKHGAYVCKKEADAAGNRPSKA